jgi:hypothetical protein
MMLILPGESTIFSGALPNVSEKRLFFVNHSLLLKLLKCWSVFFYLLLCFKFNLPVFKPAPFTSTDGSCSSFDFTSTTNFPLKASWYLGGTFQVNSHSGCPVVAPPEHFK